MSRLSPINQARWARFKSNRRGYWSLWIFLALFVVTLFSELIANDKPLLVKYDGKLYTPFIVNYSETTFGGQFDTRADFRDPTSPSASTATAGHCGRLSAITMTA